MESWVCLLVCFSYLLFLLGCFLALKLFPSYNWRLIFSVGFVLTLPIKTSLFNFVPVLPLWKFIRNGTVRTFQFEHSKQFGSFYVTKTIKRLFWNEYLRNWEIAHRYNFNTLTHSCFKFTIRVIFRVTLILHKVLYFPI